MGKFIVIETDDNIWFFLGGQMVEERPDRVEDEYYFVSEFDAADDLHNLASSGERSLWPFMEIVTGAYTRYGVRLY